MNEKVYQLGFFVIYLLFLPNTFLNPMAIPIPLRCLWCMRKAFAMASIAGLHLSHNKLPSAKELVGSIMYLGKPGSSSNVDRLCGMSQ